MGKKRKLEVDVEAERSLYSSFVQAANAVSQLYTQGVQQQRRAAAAASKATLVGLDPRAQRTTVLRVPVLVLTLSASACTCRRGL
jgi:hypothetical protein